MRAERPDFEGVGVGGFEFSGSVLLGRGQLFLRVDVGGSGIGCSPRRAGGLCNFLVEVSIGRGDRVEGVGGLLDRFDIPD